MSALPSWSCGSHDPMPEAQPSHTSMWKNPLIMFRISANLMEQSLRPEALEEMQGLWMEKSPMPLSESGVNRDC